MERLKKFLARHPLVRDALIWAIPAIIFGAALRILFLSYSPYAYWGSDSKSYFGLSYDFLTTGKLSFYDKRRWIYPIALVPVAILPGSPLRWLALLQHLSGVLTLIPLAYCVRKAFVGWKWLVIPVTMIFAGLPLSLWYEHEMIAESLFFNSVVWACAGWFAWVNARDPVRSGRLWWWFFVPFAIMFLTKPAGRFFLPAVLIGLVAVKAWRVLRWRHAVAGAVMLALGMAMGQDSQAAWLLYSSAFPLTRLDTPLHAEYKEQIRDMVEESRRNISGYYANDRSHFLRYLEKFPERPLWHELSKDTERKTRIFNDLSLEGIKARPDLFLFIAGQRMLASANASEFKPKRFSPGAYMAGFERLYFEMQQQKPGLLQFLFGMSRKGPVPSLEEVSQWVSPAPDSAATQWVQSYAAWFGNTFNFFNTPEDEKRAERTVSDFSLMLLGWWLVAGALIAFHPRYVKTVGIWTVAILSYLFGTFLLGVPSPRYFGPAWPVILMLLAMPVEMVALSLRTWVFKKGDGVRRAAPEQTA